MSHVPQIHSEGADILKGVADLGANLGKAYIHWDDKRQQGLIEDAYLKARNDMERYAADYRRNNQAGNVLDAQAAYERNGILSQAI